ncbi:hypothetical protein [Chlorobium sp. N1]|uniref:hypothetical protein n=1 Tax=Chlorobium sp. N1 TaxID=2491138 RepID=UPI001039A7A7|nr:hypothetical protein [Chlorobium sp. N1]TCD48497.1 hypothetical protein E0L29_01010 [Chlorobium sp. N1]
MSESSGTPMQTATNGVQGLAMMAPVIGIPAGLHAVSGALVAGAGILATVAPIALPVAVPLLYTFASKGDINSITDRLFPTGNTAKDEQQITPVPVGDRETKKDAAAKTAAGHNNQQTTPPRL